MHTKYQAILIQIQWYISNTILSDSKFSHNLQLIVIQGCVSLLYLCCYPSLNLVVTMDITVCPYSSIHHLELYHNTTKYPMFTVPHNFWKTQKYHNLPCSQTLCHWETTYFRNTSTVQVKNINYITRNLYGWGIHILAFQNNFSTSFSIAFEWTYHNLSFVLPLWKLHKLYL